MSGKKSIYVQRKLFHNGHTSLAWSWKIYKIQTSKTHKNSVSTDCSSSGFSFYEHLSRQFTYSVFSIFKAVICFWVKRFYTNTLLFFCYAWDSFPSENVLYVITYHYYRSIVSTRQSARAFKICIYSGWKYLY